MHPVIELLENRGLASSDQIKEAILRTWTLREVEAFAEELYHCVDSEELQAREPRVEDPLTGFNFVSSLSLTGTGSCAEHTCRVRRAHMLARFAALYADKVVAPMEIADPRADRHFHTRDAEYFFRESLAGTLLSVHEMRPVIEAGLITLAVPVGHFCEECAQTAVKRIHSISSAARHLALAHESEFSMTLETTTPMTCLRVQGPAEYLQHGQVYRITSGIPKWLPKSFHTKTSVRLSRSVLRKAKVVDELFHRVASQVAIQEIIGRRYNAKTVTDNPADLALLSQLNPVGGMHARATASLARITHVLPLMQDVSLAEAVSVRQREPDSFLVYRKALGQALREVLISEVLTQERAAEIVSDVLEPEIAKLRQMVSAARTGAIRKAAFRLAMAGAIVSLGVFRGLTPSEYAALGSGALLTGLAESLSELRGPQDIKNEHFYFLLRLTQ